MYKASRLQVFCFFIIAFHLMPELFALSELQQVYEVILDKEFACGGFSAKDSRHSPEQVL